MYTPTQHASIEDKIKFDRHFKRFVNSGYKWTLFHKWFYARLSMTFGHIAHYNRLGFFEYWFTSEANQKKFLRHCQNHPCYGHPAFTFSDVERHLQLFIKERLK